MDGQCKESVAISSVCDVDIVRIELHELLDDLRVVILDRFLQLVDFYIID